MLSLARIDAQPYRGFTVPRTRRDVSAAMEVEREEIANNRPILLLKQ